MSYDGIVLKKRRNQLGLTQQEAADKASINIKQDQCFETGERNNGCQLYDDVPGAQGA